MTKEQLSAIESRARHKLPVPHRDVLALVEHARKLQAQVNELHLLYGALVIDHLPEEDDIKPYSWGPVS